MISMCYTPSYTTGSEQICPACNGAKIQINKDGIRVLCPVCGGAGKFSLWQPPIYISETHSTSSDKHMYQVFQ